MSLTKDELSEAEQKEMEEELNKIIDNYEETWKNKLSLNSILSSIFFISVFLLLGVPIWYRTTTPERWPFPDISTLMVRSQTLAHHYKISIVLLDTTLSIQTSDLREYLQKNYQKRVNFDNSLSFIQEWSVRTAFDWELSDFSSINLENSNKLLDEIDQKLFKENNPELNSMIFYILPRNITSDKFIYMGKYRSFFINLNQIPEQCKKMDLVICLAEQINEKVQHVQFIMERFYSIQAHGHEQNSFLLLTRDFDFLFDIIYEEDETTTDLDLLERKNRHANLIENIEALLERFYTHKLNFTKYFRMNFITQVLHFVFPNKDFLSSKLLNNHSNNDERLLPLSSLESILNRIESSRVEHDNDKSYHFMLYITSPSSSPLKFFNTNTNQTSNLITTPFRGSMLILNSDDDLYRGFRQLIRTFFCMTKQNDFPDEFFTQLEIESIVRALVQKHILKTLNSLESIERLLNKVSNMVIKENIAKLIHDSLEFSMKAADLLSETGDFTQAYENSWRAYWSSEKAFYDPSLLSLLYFPEDQKYAIYLPLFMPICIPFFNNIRYLIQLLRNGKIKKE